MILACSLQLQIKPLHSASHALIKGAELLEEVRLSGHTALAEGVFKHARFALEPLRGLVEDLGKRPGFLLKDLVGIHDPLVRKGVVWIHPSQCCGCLEVKLSGVIFVASVAQVLQGSMLFGSS